MLDRQPSWRGRVATLAAVLVPFAPTSIWNAPLSSRAAVDPNSGAYVSNLLAQVARSGPWLNTYAYSTPVFTVPASQRNVTVKLDDTTNPQGPALRRSWLRVPVPSRARPAAGTDAHMVVWQPATDRMWEFWKMARRSDGWHARWGGTITRVSRSPGYYADPSRWGATATSLPLLGGLIRPSELAAGHINHALAMAIPAARAGYFDWPAQRTDGWVRSRTAIAEGQRFRLDPRLDLRSLSLPPLVRMIAEATQRYGIIVRDQAGAVTFYGEDTDAEGVARNPYYGAHGFFEGQYVSNLLRSFPWSHLQALKSRLQCCWHR